MLLSLVYIYIRTYKMYEYDISVNMTYITTIITVTVVVVVFTAFVFTTIAN